MMFTIGKTQDEIESIIDNVSIIVKKNFRLNESEQIELATSLNEFYFQKRNSPSEYMPRLADVSTH